MISSDTFVNNLHKGSWMMLTVYMNCISQFTDSPTPWGSIFYPYLMDHNSKKFLNFNVVGENKTLWIFQIYLWKFLKWNNKTLIIEISTFSNGVKCKECKIKKLERSIVYFNQQYVSFQLHLDITRSFYLFREVRSCK